MRFARIVFWIAGVVGLVVLAPMYVLEARFGLDYPPAVTHPEFFYGFAGVSIAWQIAFLIIGGNSIRYRPLMLAGIVEKFSYAVAIFVLALQNRIAAPLVLTGAMDLLFGILFVMAWLRTPKHS
jgi:hypothetical protein